jgi:drug/metabolite transporter (DMT)-like permease
VIGVAAMVVGLIALVLADPGEGSPTGGVLIRAGAVLGAVALVLPGIRRPSLPTLLVAGAGLVLVLIRPGLVWAALIGWVAWALLSRQRRTSSSDS